MWNEQDLSFNKLINRVTTDSDGKKYYEEFGDKTINITKNEIWDSEPDSDPAQAVLDGVAQLYTLYVLTEDVTVPNQQTYYAGPSFGARLKDWISPKYGEDYQVQLYDNTDVLIDQTNSVDWYFDYATGILVFNGDTSSFAKPFKITAYRYVGVFGVSAAANVYIEQAFTSQTSVVVNHGWNTRPIVSIIDASNEIIEADVVYTDLDNVTVNFSLPQTGTIILQSSTGIASPFLPLSGGTMSGDINMNGNSIKSNTVLFNFVTNSLELTTDDGNFNESWIGLYDAEFYAGFESQYLYADDNEIRLHTVTGMHMGVHKTNGAYLRHSGIGYFGYLKLTNLTADRNFEFPNASGTLALTSDLSAYLPLAGGTMTGNIVMSSAGQYIYRNSGEEPTLLLTENVVALTKRNPTTQLFISVYYNNYAFTDNLSNVPSTGTRNFYGGNWQYGSANAASTNNFTWLNSASGFSLGASATDNYVFGNVGGTSINSSYNLLVGSLSGVTVSGSYNVILSAASGLSIASGSTNNIFMGSINGTINTSASYNGMFGSYGGVTISANFNFLIGNGGGGVISGASNLMTNNHSGTNISGSYNSIGGNLGGCTISGDANYLFGGGGGINLDTNSDRNTLFGNLSGLSLVNSSQNAFLNNLSGTTVTNTLSTLFAVNSTGGGTFININYSSFIGYFGGSSFSGEGLHIHGSTLSSTISGGYISTFGYNQLIVDNNTYTDSIYSNYIGYNYDIDNGGGIKNTYINCEVIDNSSANLTNCLLLGVKNTDFSAYPLRSSDVIMRSVVFAANNFWGELTVPAIASSVSWSMPIISGTIALTSDIVVYTASNGLTKTVNDIALGGTLTANTTIGGAFNLFLGNIGNRISNGGMYTTSSIGFNTETSPVDFAQANFGTSAGASFVSIIANISGVNKTLVLDSGGLKLNTAASGFISSLNTNLLTADRLFEFPDVAGTLLTDNDYGRLDSYTVAGVPSAASNTGRLIYISNESGGPVPAFSDGTDWRRVTDRNIIS